MEYIVSTTPSKFVKNKPKDKKKKGKYIGRSPNLFDADPR